MLCTREGVPFGLGECKIGNEKEARQKREEKKEEQNPSNIKCKPRKTCQPKM